jgi:hypothetical protein
LAFGILQPGQGALCHRKDQPLRLGDSRNEAIMAAILEWIAPPENAFLCKAHIPMPRKHTETSKLHHEAFHKNHLSITANTGQPHAPAILPKSGRWPSV